MRSHTLYLAVMLTITAFCGTLRAEVAPGEMAGALEPGLSHPYLYFSEEDKPAMLERIANDPECRDIMARLVAEGGRYLHTPVGTWLEWIKDDKGGLSGFNRTNTGAALKLAFLYQMTGDLRYADKAWEFADAACSCPDWTGGEFHRFPIIYHRVWPWNVPDDQVNFNYDIHTGDISREMAAVYDWLYTALDRTRRDRIRSALLEHTITPVRGCLEYHWWSTAHRCNWTSVCYSGLACASAALILDDPGLVDVLAAAHDGIEAYLGAFGVDGGWQEGCSYWDYGFPQSVYAADVIANVTGGRLDLFRHPALADNTVNFPVYTMFPNNRSVYFCDSYSRRPGRTWILNRLASRTGSGLAEWYRENFSGGGGDIFDIIWPRSGVTPEPPEHTSYHFRGIDWVVMRSDFTDNRNVTVACKAGFNDDPHHGHLDCGTFVVQWLNEEFISEAGLRGYDRVYFWEDRWDSPQASSVGHNLVFVNGELQIPAKLKNQPWKEDVGGRVLEFRTSDGRDYALMDPTNAYPGDELRGWRRHIVHDKPLVTVVLDEVTADRGDDITVRFHSKCGIEPGDGYTLLTGKSGTMALIPVMEGDWEFEPGHHAFQRIREGTDFEWIPYLDVRTEARGERTVVATVIVPVEDAEDAVRTAASCTLTSDGTDAVTLRFTSGGTVHSCRFDGTGGDGWRLTADDR